MLLRSLPPRKRTSSILQLASDIDSGRVEQLFIFGGDPVYNAPRSITLDRKTKLALDWPELQKRVPDVVRLGHYEDATSALSQWHIPAAHYLETWSDGLTPRSFYVPIQPMILPLFGGLSELDLLQMLLGQPSVDGPQLVQETFRQTAPPGDFDTAWNKFLHDGFAATSHTEGSTTQVQWQHGRRRRAHALEQRSDRADERFAGDRAHW